MTSNAMTGAGALLRGVPTPDVFEPLAEGELRPFEIIPEGVCQTCAGALYVRGRATGARAGTRLEGFQPNVREVERCPACNVPTAFELIAEAGVPERYAKCTFATFPVDLEKVEAVAAMRAWVADPLESVLLMGANGRGKTGLAVAAVLALCERGIAARFTPAVDLLNRVRASFDDENAPDVLAPYRSAPILVLDDLGVVRVTPWVQEQMTALIEERRMADRLTVITCDVGSQDLLDWYGPRLVSRLREFRRITVGGRDMRGAS